VVFWVVWLRCRIKFAAFTKITKMDVMIMKGEFAVIELNSPVTPFMKETAFQRGIVDMVVSGKNEVAG
jgi:hypothetical protein